MQPYRILIDGIKEAVKGMTETLCLHDERTIYGWGNHCTQILDTLITEGKITREEFEGYVHERLITLGRECYLDHLKGADIERLRSPAAFAYALKHEAFSQEEEKGMKFGRYECKEGLLRVFHRDLKHGVVSALLGHHDVLTFEIAGKVF
jgi:hypothetical protein